MMLDRNSFILHRYIAKIIDILLAWAMALVIPPVGPLAGLLYIFIADGFHEGQSPGKRLIGLKVVNRNTLGVISFKESLIRNIPFAIAYLFFIIPFLGWFLFIVVGIPVLLLECYFVCEAERGMRVGDVMADTVVVEAKE